MAEEDCKNVVFYPPSDQVGGVRKIIPCSPEEEVRDNAFVSSNPAPAFVTTELRLDPIIVGNIAVTSLCPANSDEATYSIPAFRYSYDLYLSAVITLEDTTIAYIVANNAIEKVNKLYKAGQLTAAELVVLLHVTHVQAADILEAIVSKQDELTQTAQSQADSMLVCTYVNDAVTATCTDPAMAKNAEHKDAIFTVTIAEGRVSSTISKEDANDKARSIATAQLNCLYINDLVNVDCVTDKGKTEAVPTDMTPVYPGLSLRVGSVTVPIGSFTSTVSKEEANNNARLFALQELNCFYVNDEIHIQCADPDARGVGKTPADPSVDANPTKGTTGQSVTIPNGFVTSHTNTKLANEEATNYAQTLLECCYTNEEIYLSCPDYVLTNPDGTPMLDKFGNPMTVPANQAVSPNWQITVPAGTYSDCTSQKNANDLAYNAVASSLECYYCNQIIVPSCVPTWVVEAATTGVYNPTTGQYEKIALPLDLSKPLINPMTGEQEDVSKWSLDATVGMKENMYCSADFVQSQQIADNAAQDKVTSTMDQLSDCSYGNDTIIATCSGVDPNRQGEPYIFFSKFPAGAKLFYENTVPKQGNYITIASDTIIVTASEVPGMTDDIDVDARNAMTKNYANQLAIELAQNTMMCVFTNPLTNGICEEVTSIALESDKWIIGGSKSLEGLSVESNTVKNPIVIPAGTFMSQIGLSDIAASVNQFVLSTMFCDYCNDLQTATCITADQLNKAEVPYCSVRAASLEEANKTAADMAANMLVCLDLSNVEGTPGPPGPAGPPGTNGTDGKNSGGDCQGPCYGVYT